MALKIISFRICAKIMVKNKAEELIRGMRRRSSIKHDESILSNLEKENNKTKEIDASIEKKTSGLNKSIKNYLTKENKRKWDLLLQGKKAPKMKL